MNKRGFNFKKVIVESEEINDLASAFISIDKYKKTSSAAYVSPQVTYVDSVEDINGTLKSNNVLNDKENTNVDYSEVEKIDVNSTFQEFILETEILEDIIEESIIETQVETPELEELVEETSSLYFKNIFGFEDFKSMFEHDKTIIFPKLGAFTLTNVKNGESYFMAFLKHDDGKIAKYLAERDNLSLDLAKEKLTEFVSDINETIDRLGVFSFDNFGVLQKNATDEFEFNQTQENVIPFKDSFGDIEFKSGVYVTVSERSEKVEASQEVFTLVVEPSFVEEKVEIVIPEIITEEKVFEIVKEELPVISEEKIEEVSIPEIIIEQKVIVEKEEVLVDKVSLEKDEVEIEVLNKISDEEFLTEENDTIVAVKKKKGAKFWIFTFLLIVILGGGTFVGLNFEKYKHLIPLAAKYENTELSEEKMIKELEFDATKPTKEKSDKSEEMVHSPEVKEESPETPVVKEVVEEKQEVAEVPTENFEAPKPKKKAVKKLIESSVASTTTESPAQSGTFYIILGTFSKKVNAISLVDKLKSEGKSGATMIERDDKFSVSFGQYSSKEEAMTNLSAAKVGSTKAWLFHKD